MKNDNMQQYNTSYFWLTFDQKIVWIILIMCISLFVNGGYLVVIGGIFFIIYGLYRQGIEEEKRKNNKK